MKLFKEETHITTNELKRIAEIILYIFFFIIWMAVVMRIKSLATEPLVKQKHLQKKLSVVENAKPLEINYIPENLYLDIPLSHELQDYVKTTVKTIKPELVFAVMEKESGFDNNKIGQAQEVGYCQIHPSNFGWLAKDCGLTDLHDPKQNIKAGIILLEYLTERESDIHMGLMYYNMTPNAAERQFSKGIFQSEYSREVVKRAEEIEVTNE